MYTLPHSISFPVVSTLPPPTVALRRYLRSRPGAPPPGQATACPPPSVPRPPHRRGASPPGRPVPAAARSPNGPHPGVAPTPSCLPPASEAAAAAPAWLLSSLAGRCLPADIQATPSAPAWPLFPLAGGCRPPHGLPTAGTRGWRPLPAACPPHGLRTAGAPGWRPLPAGRTPDVCARQKGQRFCQRRSGRVMLATEWLWKALLARRATNDLAIGTIGRKRGKEGGDDELGGPRKKAKLSSRKKKKTRDQLG